MSRAHVLAVCNRKGGTGKTATTVNLAAVMAATGRKVLILDLDSQSHCAPGLGITSAQAPFLHACLMNTDISLGQTLQRTGLERVWLSQADPGFDHSHFCQPPEYLRKQLEISGVLDVFDLIIIDTPPSLDLLLRSALCAADQVLVPFVPHFLSYEGIKQLIQLMYDIKQTHNPGLALLGFVPAMVTVSKRHHREVLHQVELLFGRNRLLPGIRTDIRVAEAFEAGEPVCSYAPASRAASDFRDLATSVRERLETGTQPAASPAVPDAHTA